MERSSLPISSAGKPDQYTDQHADQFTDQFVVNQSQFLNRLTDERPNRFSNQFPNQTPNQAPNQFPVLNLTPSMMTSAPARLCNDCNNNHIDSNRKTSADLKVDFSKDHSKDHSNGNNYNSTIDDKAAASNSPPAKRRRELGNRGYIKKMRKIPFLGIFCAIMYAFFMSTSVALLKIVPNLHPIAVLVYR